jgi:hypothetical protein
MKKTLLAVAVLLSGAVAQATPAVGDYSDYKIKNVYVADDTNPAETEEFSLKEAINAYDAKTEAYTLDLTFTDKDGVTELGKKSYQVPGENFPTAAIIQDVLVNCVSYGGTNEHITVAAGEFDTCAVSDDDGAGTTVTSWYGMAPIEALIKFSAKDAAGNSADVELQKVNMAKEVVVTPAN